MHLPDRLKAAGWQRLKKGESGAFADVSVTWKRGAVRLAITAETLAFHDGQVHTYFADGGQLNLYRLYVDKDCRGQGLARTAVAELMGFADEMDLEFYAEPQPFELEGKTLLTRKVLHDFYAGFGFVDDCESGRVMRRTPTAPKQP